MVVFTDLAEEEAGASVHLSEPFWTMRLVAEDRKDARHKARREIDRNPDLRFLKREGWRICHVGIPHGDIKAAGPLRAPGISI